MLSALPPIAPGEEPRPKRRAGEAQGHLDPATQLMVAKLALKLAQEGRLLLALTTTHWLIPTTSELSRHLQAEQKRYSQAVRQEGKQHKRGPPQPYVLRTLLSSLLELLSAAPADQKNEDLIRRLTDAVGKVQSGQLTDSIVECRLSKCFDSSKRRLLVGVRHPELDALITEGLTTLKFQRLTGRAPPSYLEREIQRKIGGADS